MTCQLCKDETNMTGPKRYPNNTLTNRTSTKKITYNAGRFLPVLQRNDKCYK